MITDMRYRALVFDDDELIRGLLWQVLDARGYEVFTFPEPGACPLFRNDSCECVTQQACCDFLITDLRMPGASGLDYIKHQKIGGCRCPNIALITGSGSWSEIRAAQELGCQVFQKPVDIDVLEDWLEKCEAAIDAGRTLSDWPFREEGRFGP